METKNYFDGFLNQLINCKNNGNDIKCTKQNP